MKRVIVVVCAILGMIVGVGIGEAVSSIPYLQWLSIGGEIGFANPIVLDLNFLKITFGIWCKISVGGVIFLLIFALVSQWVTRWLKL